MSRFFSILRRHGKKIFTAEDSVHDPAFLSHNEFHHEFSRIEGLPTEIQLQIFCMLEPDDLKSLVYASHTLHQQYSVQRKFILGQLLQIALPGLASTAIAVNQSMNFDGGSVPAAMQFLDNQRTTQLDSLTECTEDQIVLMAIFHWHCIVPLRRSYTEWALSNLADKCRTPRSDFTLSASEELRITRAMYRYQLGCNLLSQQQSSDPSWPTWPDSMEGVLADKFFLYYMPWEVEEMICIHRFACAFYDVVLLETGLRQGPSHRSVDGTFFGIEVSQRAYHDTIVACTGLDVMAKIRYRIKNNKPVVDILRNLQTYRTTFSCAFENPIGHDASTTAWMTSHIKPECLLELRTPFPFTGDADSDGPPFAWTVLWRDTYSDMTGYYIPNTLKDWGYVMWDARRIKETGADELLKKQWNMRLIHGNYAWAEFFDGYPVRMSTD
ncbi:hypothetical protein K461DRAFT_297284 [Myriangium duriaei CBS 260.36]|uniref:F-box domain-containing protein n=1 Tax=Myriangium duriaei CBS 260.36 TaxID=1168546 RepID=A0A9P4MCI5_9PEZI|nr:hypothetical protein K461DRAFT_297284 [Myriangium duriaei CBS 260.36]